MPAKTLSATAKKKLDALMKRCRLHGFRETLIDEAGGEDEAHALAWEVIANDVRDIGDVDVIRFVSERAPTPERAEMLAAHLARYRPSGESWSQYLPHWEDDIDALVFRALPLSIAAFAAAELHYEAWAKLGLAFVRARRGETIAAGDAARIVVEMARQAARGKLVGSFGDRPTPCLDASGSEVALPTRTLDDVRGLALFVAPEQGRLFDETLAETTREDAWSTIASVDWVLCKMARDELLVQLAHRYPWAPQPDRFYGALGADTYDAEQMVALFDARLTAGTDTPSDLFAAARTLVAEVSEHGAERGDQ